MHLIIELLNHLTPYGTYAYLAIVLILLTCGFGLPLPEDVVLVTGGILAARHVTEFWPTVGFALFGVIVGDGIVFFIGKKVGPKIKRTRLFSYFVKEETDKKIMSWFSRFGDKVIFFARFAPGLRMPLFLTAGAYQVPAWKFFILDGTAALISVPVWVWVGHLFGENLELLEQKIHHLQIGLYGLLGIILLAIVGVWLVKRKVKLELT